MDTNKQLIISLLQQDLKHYHLVRGVERLGFIHEDKQTLTLMDMVAECMGIKQGNISNEWISAYVAFMEDASQKELGQLIKDLIPIAEECYSILLKTQ